MSSYFGFYAISGANFSDATLVASFFFIYKTIAGIYSNLFVLYARISYLGIS